MSFIRADAALRSLGRMARTRELRLRGVPEAELTRAVRAGEILRPRQGVYALPDTPDALLHSAEHGGTVGCCEAGLLLGLWILRTPPEHHVWMGTVGTPRGGCEGCRMHWDAGHVDVGRPPPVLVVLLQIASCADEDTFFAALESALRRSLLSPKDIGRLCSRLPADMRWLVAFARGDADSGLESLIRLRLHRLGIDVRTQVRIDGVGEVDLVIGGRLIIEADGAENHGEPAARSKDLRRDAAASALGFETLRFTYAMVVHDWPTVERAILGAMIRHGLR
ncbi:type IV toxin-antitoxin system AbiEi family antitoxin domain-containing protein [Microbacterium hydrocarbonoxydans]|uniref:type IV toxin-antitoxin system AbiEi family antitoxin domain-containing protein n=1 Tax=Microbacterium hydrocarbonoxydans TaxID=273678 RepID=UPI00203C3856|nr:type IV toxin-antitoxin system AbiEi family antitoxin domain-containing protein [Microbacterium hydrocarbonoxydans]MCM3780035.1 type IV toxin-antitoxin system AbiEi family antitoxin domain-containing protein [Microbacterium hydrocarbonoxydans]